MFCRLHLSAEALAQRASASKWKIMLWWPLVAGGWLEREVKVLFVLYLFEKP